MISDYWYVNKFLQPSRHFPPAISVRHHAASISLLLAYQFCKYCLEDW